MPTLTAGDGTKIFYQDSGAGQPIIFLHGWPLSGDMWDNQMMVFGQAGFRVIAPDRRGFGRSGQNWSGNDYNHSADDLAALIMQLGLSNVVLVSHSMGGGEIVRYVTRYGTGKLAKIITIAANVPQIIKTPANPDGFPLSQFDDMRAELLKNRTSFLTTMPKTPFGYNHLAARADHALLHDFWRQGMMAGIKPMYDFIAQFSETDFTGDLQQIDVPILIIHGDADEGTPIAATALRAAKLYPRATLKIYPGGTHMISILQAEAFNADLLAFINK